jgi:hypothetical protein
MTFRITDLATYLSNNVNNYIPDLEDGSLSIDTITKAGNTATITLTSPTDLSQIIADGDAFKIRGVRGVHNIESIEYIDDNSDYNFKITTTTPYVKNFNDKIIIQDCDYALLNNEFEIIDIYDSKSIYINVAGSEDTVITTLGKLQEPFIASNTYGYNLFTTLTKIDNSTYTYQVNENLPDETTGDMHIAFSVNVKATADLSRADVDFRGETSNPFTLYVVNQGIEYNLTGSGGNSFSIGDTDYANTDNKVFGSYAIANVGIYAFITTSQDSLGAETIDKCYNEYRSALNKCLLSEGYTMTSCGTSPDYAENGAYLTFDYQFQKTFQFDKNEYVDNGSQVPLSRINNTINKDEAGYSQVINY